MHQASLEPAAIRFMLECLQESARRSGYFLPDFSIYLYPQEPRKWLIILKFFLWSLMDIDLFIKAYTAQMIKVLKVCRTPGPTAC